MRSRESVELLVFVNVITSRGISDLTSQNSPVRIGPAAFPVSMAIPDSLYVARPAANSFLENLDLAFKAPAQQPIVFHAWGLGGVGKTTLLDRAQVAHQQRCTLPDQVTIAEVKFGDTANTGTPLGVMKVLHSQLSPTVGDPQKDPFYELERRYTTTLETLKTKTEDGSGQASDKQIEIVKKYSQLALQGASLMFAAGTPVGTALSVAAPHIGELGELGASILDDAKGLFNRHQATRHDETLQVLMLNPLLELTKAFVKSLQTKAAVQPLLLVLDFYEKVPTEVDRWFCGTLLGNTSLQAYPVRIVSAGRKQLLNKDHWSERHQNDSAVYEQELERFEDEQAREYLNKIGITDDVRVKRIITATRGLPYYLNWVREEYIKGHEPDFSEGAQEIKKVLLRQFTPHETQLVQIVACCRRFDGDLIKHLTRCADLEIPLEEKETAKGRFRWLLDLPFTQRTENEHRFDDVARDVLRQAFYEESQQQFRAAHQSLVEYYMALADEEVYEEAHISEQYDSEDWRSYQAEALYHHIFANPRQAELQLITRALEGIYLSAEEIVQNPLQAISAEYQEDTHLLIKSGLQKSLKHVKKIVDQGWQLRYSENLEELLNHTGKEIEQPLSLFWKRTEKLVGLAKFVAYFYHGKYSSASQRLTWLKKAQAQAEEIVTSEASEFSSDLFTFALGYWLDEFGCYEDAISSYDEALKHKPDKHDAWTNRGTSFEHLGDYEQALASHEEALKHKSDDHLVWYNRGVQLGYLERYEDAIASYDEALKHKPDDPDAWNNRGIALGNLERYEDAIASYDKALKHKSDKHDAWNNRGIALGNLERYEDEIASYDKALKHKPDYHLAWHNRGIALGNLERYEDAIASYDEALKHKPDYHLAWNNRGVALDKLERYEEAIASYDEALKHKPDNHLAWNNRGIALRNLERYEDAIASYDEALKHNPDDHDAWNNRGLALDELERYEDAIASYDEALKHKPDKHEAWNNRGWALNKLERYAEAIASYDEALKHKPDDHLAWHNHGIALRKLERYEDAIASYDEAIKHKPDDHLAWNNRGWALGKLERYEDEIASYDEALKYKSDYSKAWHNRGFALGNLERYEEAIASYDEALALKPDYELAHYNKACYYALLGNPDAALESLQQAINLAPDKYREMAKTDTDFDSLRHDSRFQALIANPEST